MPAAEMPGAQTDTAAEQNQADHRAGRGAHAAALCKEARSPAETHRWESQMEAHSGTMTGRCPSGGHLYTCTECHHRATHMQLTC